VRFRGRVATKKRGLGSRKWYSIMKRPPIGSSFATAAPLSDPLPVAQARAKLKEMMVSLVSGV